MNDQASSSTIAVVTGSNSGIGRSAAVDLAAKGWTVYGTMRSLDKGDKLASMAEEAGVVVHPVVCDVADSASVNRAMAEILDDAGRIDVLVNNAGIGGNAVMEECSIDLYAEVMNVNLHGVVRCSQAVLPQMRERGSGCIVNVSSITGLFAAIAQSPYVTSKWAVEGLSEGMAQELTPFGIRVVVIEPGIVRTAIMAKNTGAPNESGAYDAHYRRLFAFYAKGLQTPGVPSEVADVIYEAVTTDQYRLRWTCGWGGPELSTNRALVSDEDWVALGAIEDDDEYRARFSELFELDIL
ncbi:MAG: SDR family oxidoreductase [Actinomycetota bacterium]|nr:SDR family oxidoreductase [Actinomycetota bacterium]